LFFVQYQQKGELIKKTTKNAYAVV